MPAPGPMPGMPPPGPMPGMPSPGMPPPSGMMPGMSPPSLMDADDDETMPEFDTALTFASQEERDELGRKLLMKVRQALASLSTRHEYVRAWRQQYESKSIPKDTPWPNAASLNIPTTRGAVDTIHSHLYQAINGTSPLFRVEASAADDVEAAQIIEQVLQWQMIEQINMPNAWDFLIKNGLIDGTSIAKVPWRQESKRTRKPGFVKDDAGNSKLSATGKPIRALVEENEYVINQPDVEVIDILDFCLYPANAKSIESAIMVGHRVWKTSNDLRKGVRDGKYDKKQVERVMDGKASLPDMQGEQYGGDEARTAQAGMSMGGPTESDDRSFEIFELISLYGAGDDDIKEDCLFSLEMSTGTLLCAEVYPYWHNERCYVDYTPMPRSGSFFGYSIPELLESLHAEINAIRNQRVDAGTLVLSPVLAARRTVKFDFGRQRWRPGAVLHMDDPKNDVNPISFQSGGIQQSFSEEQSAREQAEKITGASDYSQGSSPSRSRTLGEVSSVLSEGNKKWDIIIARLHRSNNRVANQVIGLNRQYLPASTEYSITRNGQRVFLTLSADDLRARVRIQAQGNTLNANKELELQKWETLFQMGKQDPLMQKPTRQYAINAGYIASMGVVNPVPYIGTEGEAKEMEMKMESAPPPQPPPPQLAGKLDETATLALMFKEQQISPQDYQNAGQMVTGQTGAIAGAKAAAVPEEPDTLGTDVAAKTHDSHLRIIEAEHASALKRLEAEHAANVGTAHGIVQQVAGQALTPPPPSPYPSGGGGASPMPPAAPAKSG